ncbi:MAG: PaaR repeat-containing protein [Gammaproteobacteria bacterium]|jgi:uncharacterized Zn-binding protein involved in type VI secretion|nr:PaaR repeat-containing protein [Gammaproteobacteria bacterium]
MAAVTLRGHKCSGHGCWPPRPSEEGEPRFTVKGVPVHLQGHAWLPHTCGETHASVLQSGSRRFTVKGRQLGRVGDPVACGSTVAEGEGRFTVAD